MDTTTKGITLTSYDYKDNDKHIVLYTAQYGKITVLARGIRKAKAKLKYASHPFCFGDFQLNNTRDRYTLIGCSQIESFWELTQDVDRYYGGCVMVDSVASICQEGQANSQVLLLLLQYLKALDSGVNVLVAVVAFLLQLLQIEGYQLNVDRCNVCGNKPSYLDLHIGGVVCGDCRTASSITMPTRVVTVLKLLSDMPTNKLGNLNIPNTQLKETLQILDSYISHSLTKIKTIPQLIRL